MTATCQARTGPVWKLDGEACGCVLSEGHETRPLGEQINDLEARDHQCSCGSVWVDSIRRDR